jgi:hypothetical protein
MRELRGNPDFRGVDKKSEKREIGRTESEKGRHNEGLRQREKGRTKGVITTEAQRPRGGTAKRQNR